MSIRDTLKSIEDRLPGGAPQVSGFFPVSEQEAKVMNGEVPVVLVVPPAEVSSSDPDVESMVREIKMEPPPRVEYPEV